MIGLFREELRHLLLVLIDRVFHIGSCFVSNYLKSFIFLENSGVVRIRGLYPQSIHLRERLFVLHFFHLNKGLLNSSIQIFLLQALLYVKMLKALLLNQLPF